MAWRFRRRLPLLRGVTVNLGRRRFNSISLGVRGAHLTIGPHGRRATVGLPGSGLSYSVYDRHYAPPARTSPRLLAVGVILAALLALAVIFGGLYN